MQSWWFLQRLQKKMLTLATLGVGFILGSITTLCLIFFATDVQSEKTLSAQQNTNTFTLSSKSKEHLVPTSQNSAVLQNSASTTSATVLQDTASAALDIAQTNQPPINSTAHPASKVFVPSLTPKASLASTPSPTTSVAMLPPLLEHPLQKTISSPIKKHNFLFSPSVSSFNLLKMGDAQGPTLFVVGGIQGDEPGAFSAAALLASHYTFSQGSVWVVPDLNLGSILEKNRGIFGDMNRKFATLPKSDPDYGIITRIKKLLLSEEISLILNLHDGSGFYRPTNQGPLHNPTRWGQCVIIDQAHLDTGLFSSLQNIAQKALGKANEALLKPNHYFTLRNTKTREGDKEMEKTLSYFAVCNGKPAFGLEASKEFNTQHRAYYHLILIESFLEQMGIKYTRDFELTPDGVMNALNNNLAVAAFDNKIILPLDNVRNFLNVLPFKKDSQPQSTTSKPLLMMVPTLSNNWRIAYGNRTLTRFKPQFMDFDDSLLSVGMALDGENSIEVPLSHIVQINSSFMVTVPKGYRVNAIGARKEKNETEADVVLSKSDFLPNYSLDKSGTTFRVEFYKGKAFSGMILVQFGTSQYQETQPLTADRATFESSFGF